jgi:subfamily B ATP-binding cassette protein MsbA
MAVISSVFYIYTRWLADKIKKSSYLFADATNTLNKKIFNFLSCIPLIKSYANENKEGSEFSKLSEKMAKLRFSMDKKIRSLGPFQEIILLVAVLFLVSAAALLVVSERNELTSLFVYFYLIKRSTTFFLAINNFIGGVAIYRGPIDEVLKVFDDKDKFFINDGKREFTGLKNCMDFRELNFTYVKDMGILKNINFSIKKGEITALVGPTGSGKTTMINLIARFYDCPPSSIYIDNTDIREFTLKSLMAKIALISQDIFLFNDSIKNNIIYGLNREISDAELHQAAKRARIFDPIMEMPNKFETLVGDRGITLSGGEKQRVAIARALLKNAEILILDEATSALDLETERLIHEAIAEVIKGKTTIVIAHRLSTIKNVDTIIFLENGKIIEHGKLDDLLTKKGRFHAAWQEQRF